MADRADGHRLRVEYGRGAAEDDCRGRHPNMQPFRVWSGRDRSGVEVQERDILCSFRLKSGAEETYTGKLRGVGVSGEYKGTLLWLVRAPPTVMPSPPGLLQQSYAADAKAPADVIPALIGEVNSDIVLQSMADKDEERIGAPEKLNPGDFVVLGVGLRLRSASG